MFYFSEETPISLYASFLWRTAVLEQHGRFAVRPLVPYQPAKQVLFLYQPETQTMCKQKQRKIPSGRHYAKHAWGCTIISSPDMSALPRWVLQCSLVRSYTDVQKCKTWLYSIKRKSMSFDSMQPTGSR